MTDSLPAGEFSSWLHGMRSALSGGPGMEVACGSCVGCCTSSYFIKVRAHETEALRHIAPVHLSAPDDAGTRAMGYGATGHCPMFNGASCSIYLHRPETCRVYDCRIFTAAGMAAGGADKSTINERVARWHFEYAGSAAQAEHAAVKSAAAFLRQHPVRFPRGQVPSRPGDIAVLALKSYQVFLGPPLTHEATVAAIIAACTAFDAAAQGPSS